MQIFLFCRFPKLGEVKSRMAQECGAEKTLKIYRKMLQTVLQNLAASEFSFEVHLTGGNPSEISQYFSNYPVKNQIDGNLGDKLIYAVENWFAENDEALLIIGADQLELDNNLFKMAEKLLLKNEVVIGPAKDGGYYLIGIKKPFVEIFKNISWGSEKVLQETLAILKSYKISYGLLPEKNDIDFVADLPESWQKEFLR